MRKPTSLTALICVLYTVPVELAPSPVLANELDEVLPGAVRQKQSHVMRSYDYRDLIACWEQLAIQLEDGEDIDSTRLQVVSETDLSREMTSLDSVKRRSLVLCVRGKVRLKFDETVAHNLQSGGDDFVWALKVLDWENRLMVAVSKAAGWSEMQNYYEKEAIISKQIVRGEISISEYLRMAKQNETQLAAALSTEASLQSIHEENFTELKPLCDEVASSLIGRAKIAASE